MKVVKRIARSGRSIICTIHQPNSELFFLFDRLLLLGSGGHQIYFGDLGRRAQDFVKYLSKCSGVTPIKPRVNPASWMLIELGISCVAVEEDGDATTAPEQGRADQIVIEDEPEWASLTPAQKTVQKFKKMFLMSDQYKNAVKRINVLESIELVDVNDSVGMERHQKQVELAQVKRSGNKKNNTQHGEDNQLMENSVNTSKTTLPTTTIVFASKDRPAWFVQLGLLFQRNFNAYWRNQRFIYSRYFVQLLLAIIFGLIYLDLKAVDVASATVCSLIFIYFFHLLSSSSQDLVLLLQNLSCHYYSAFSINSSIY
jgi:hypothetical protein